eukprot:scaffold218555_cov31-Tisochrysis_lutea.AAC.1
MRPNMLDKLASSSFRIRRCTFTASVEGACSSACAIAKGRSVARGCERIDRSTTVRLELLPLGVHTSCGPRLRVLSSLFGWV